MKDRVFVGVLVARTYEAAVRTYAEAILLGPEEFERAKSAMDEAMEAAKKDASSLYGLRDAFDVPGRVQR